MRKSLILLFALLAGPLAAESPFEFWPGTSYDPRVPTHKQVLGYAPGEQITTHAGIVKYLEALASSTRQLKVFEYGKTWEGRKLVYAVLGSEANIRRLEEIRAGMQKLADPRGTGEAEARKLSASLPAVIWLSYGVHGNEISSPDAALVLAYHLLAARQDKMAGDILSKVLVLIDPLQNPDGRDRFIHNFEQAEGLEADASPLAAEHMEPWPGGRSNHYLFDMNRDWVALTQPEIRDQVKVLRQWLPLVYVDLHEMGADSTYYFAPEADPYNPHLVKEQKEALHWFGKNNARWFDKYGFDYFTREVFDAFYPGYGASWPSYYGAVAMTYEQASARGLVMRRANDTLLQFRDTVRQHFVASLATAETAALNREKLLDQFSRYRRTAIEEGGREPVREYILPRRGDTAALEKMAGLLAEHGVEMKRATAPFQAAGREQPAGSYVIPLAQPAKRLIRTLLDPNVPMDDKFVKEAERRRQKKLPDEIYDVTAWSLPLSFNVEAVASPEVSRGSFAAASPVRIPPGKVTGTPASVAYLVPWNTAGARLLAAALRENLKVLSADKPFTQNGRQYVSGTLIFKVLGNPKDLAQRLERLARATGAEVCGVNTSWVEDGVNFGSRYVVDVTRPTVALAWDRPASSTSAGWTRFVLERQFGYPVTTVRAQALAAGDLGKFQVLILPDGPGEGYASALGAGGVRRLKEWVSAGGTLIGVGGAVAFFADPKTGLLAVSQENAARPADAAKKPDVSEARRPDAAKPEAAETRVAGKLFASDEEYRKAIKAESELPDSVEGVMVRARLDLDHWITAGMGETVNALFSGRGIFTPIRLDKGVNAAVFAGADSLVAGGYMWEENRKQLAHKPLLIVQRDGRGTVIGFTADPNFRASMDGMNLLFLNAVLRGPAHARPAGRGGER